MSEPEWTIQRNGDVFCLVYYDAAGKRRRRSLGRDKGAAERLAPRIYAQLNRPRELTVETLWTSYTVDKADRAVVGTMEHTWKALRNRFGSLQPRDITTDLCRAHIAARRQAGIKDGTIHTELGHLRMVLLWATKQKKPDGSKLLDEAPHIERPAKPETGEKHLTRDEAKRLIRAARFHHMRLFITLALGTAARSGALLGLTWTRVDFERSRIYLRDPDLTRPHKGRAIVPMNRSVRAALERAQPLAVSPFVIEWAGKRVSSVKKGLAAAAERAGLGHVTPHMLRHTAAVHMAEAGIPMEEIAQYLGHRDVNVTRRIYARFSPRYLSKAASVLEYDDGETEEERGDVPGAAAGAAVAAPDEPDAALEESRPD